MARRPRGSRPHGQLSSEGVRGCRRGSLVVGRYGPERSELADGTSVTDRSYEAMVDRTARADRRPSPAEECDDRPGSPLRRVVWLVLGASLGSGRSKQPEPNPTTAVGLPCDDVLPPRRCSGRATGRQCFHRPICTTAMGRTRDGSPRLEDARGRARRAGLLQSFPEVSQRCSDWGRRLQLSPYPVW
jgi:hypothetical protein